MHCGVCACVCSCLYKYSSLFHSVDSYFTERNSNITAPLRTDKAITQYVSFIKYSSILPQQSAVLSNTSSALLQAAPSQTSALSWANITQPRWKRGKSMQGRVRRVESLLCFDRRLTDKTFSPVISGIMKDRSRGGTTTRVCCILCVVGFVYFCLWFFLKIFTPKPSEPPTEPTF